MITGTVSYSAPIEGLELEEEMELQVPEPEIEKIALKTHKSGETELIAVTITLKDVFASENFGRITHPVVKRVLNRIMFYYGGGVRISEPRCEGYSLLKNATSDVVATLATNIVSWDHLEGAYRPAEEGRKRLKEHLENPASLPGEALYDLFNYSSRQKDPVTQFMFLYNIILLLHNDTQRDVDAFILAEEPGVKMIQRTYTDNNGKSKTKNETIYTNLRNRVGHIIPGTDLSKTYEEISQYVSSFEQLVKKAIK